jgi:recombination protein RecA
MPDVNDLKKYVIKRTGSEYVMKTAREAPVMGFLRSGSFLLDFALLGGYPEGRISTLFGVKSSGKTTLCLKGVGNFQKKYDGIKNPKKLVAWIDTEQSFDALWATKNGVNIDELILIIPPDGDAAADIFNECMSNDDIGLVVLDSIPNLVSFKETEKSVEDQTMAPVATILQRMLRKTSTIIAQASAKGDIKTALLINQWREKPVMMGDPRSLPGGRFVRHYSTLELEIYNRKLNVEKDENDIDSVAYNDHSFKVHKNRAGNSIQEGEFVLNRRSLNGLPEAAIDDNQVVVNYAQKFNLVTGAGQKWNLIHPYTGEVLDFKSKTLLTEHVRNNPDINADLQKKVISLQRVKMGMSEDF